jgi:hypothetical protein
MRSPSPYQRAELKRKVSNEPDFGETWEEREAIAEETAEIEFGCDFKPHWGLLQKWWLVPD